MLKFLWMLPLSDAFPTRLTTVRSYIFLHGNERGFSGFCWIHRTKSQHPAFWAPKGIYPFYSPESEPFPHGAEHHHSFLPDQGLEEYQQCLDEHGRVHNIQCFDVFLIPKKKKHKAALVCCKKGEKRTQISWLKKKLPCKAVPCIPRFTLLVIFWIPIDIILVFLLAIPTYFRSNSR